MDARFSAAGAMSYIDTLADIVAALSPTRPFHDGLADVLSALAGHLPFSRPHIVVQDPASGSLHLSLAHGQAAVPHLTYAPGTGVTGQVFATGRSLVVERMKDHPDFLNRLFGRDEAELASLAFVCVPVFAEPAPPRPTTAGEEDQGEQADERRPVGTLSADTPVAPCAELEARRRFLEVVATLVGHHVAYVQEDMVRRLGHYTRRDDEPLPGELRHMPSIVILSKSMNHVLHHVAQAAPGRVTVLLRGESGTGKELMAEAIHRLSPRRARPLVKFNCAALPAELVEGELFGWRKGAFTGAVDNRRGLFEQAHGGTLFLDEIGDLSPAAQAKMLRAVQEGEIVRLGGEAPIKVDVRLVCATHQPLEKLVEQGRFRADLFYRINVFPIFLPSLRERPEDVLPLAEHFLESFARESGQPPKRLSARAGDALRACAWPGNVRELRNILERAVLLCEDDVIRACHLPPSMRDQEPVPDVESAARPLDFRREVENLERRLLDEALRRAGGNIHQTARDLGLTYRVCAYKLRGYGLDYRRYL